MSKPPPIPSNDEVGINIDDFIGHPIRSSETASHDVIVKCVLLSAGDPATPVSPGDVLLYFKELATATLEGQRQTPLTSLPDQLMFYIEGGKGRLDDGDRYWDLEKGVGVLIPPGVLHRFTNTADELLEMILLAWQPEVEARPLDEIRVRSIDQMPFPTPTHWGAYLGKGLFGPDDGLHPNAGFYIVHVPPMMMGDPHAHEEGFEEGWIKLSPDDAYMLLGSELREMPVHTAFLAPPNGKTVHSVLNVKKDTTQQWFYFARFPYPLPRNPDWPIVEPKVLDHS